MAAQSADRSTDQATTQPAGRSCNCTTNSQARRCQAVWQQGTGACVSTPGGRLPNKAGACAAKARVLPQRVRPEQERETQQSVGGRRRRGLMLFALVLLLALPPLELPPLVPPEQERERHQRHRPPSRFENDRSGIVGRSAYDGGQSTYSRSGHERPGACTSTNTTINRRACRRSAPIAGAQGQAVSGVVGRARGVGAGGAGGNAGWSVGGGRGGRRGGGRGGGQGRGRRRRRQRRQRGAEPLPSETSVIYWH